MKFAVEPVGPRHRLMPSAERHAQRHGDQRDVDRQPDGLDDRGVQVRVVQHRAHRIGEVPAPGRGAGRLVLRPGFLGFRGDGDLDRVVMAVVAALDLDDQVPAGDRAHQVDGVHGGFGARVGEPPAREAEPAGQFGGHRDRVRGGLGEVGAVPGLVGYCFRDRRVSVPGQRGAVTAVQVDVLVAVDVPDLRAAAVAQPDRLRHGDLPARCDAAG
jgi:hypothetical protein